VLVSGISAIAAADLLLLPEGAIVMVSVSVYDGRDSRDRQASCHVEGEGEGPRSVYCYVGTESGCCAVQGVVYITLLR
jgi:hypothetical protein